MPIQMISKRQVLEALTAATIHAERPTRPGDRALVELSMDELAAAAGVSRATLYRLFGSQQHLLQALGLEPPPTVRSRILDAALELVGRHGLAELSMDELASAAGVSRATLYRLFAGKEALFAALVRTYSPYEPIAAVLEAAEDRPPAEVVPAVAHAMAAAMDGHMGLLLQLLLELAREPDPDGVHGTSEDAIQGMRTRPLVSGYLAGQMAAGHLRRMDPELAFQALAGPIVMHLVQRPPAGSPGRGSSSGRESLEEAVDELVAVWLRAMAADQPARPQPASSGAATTKEKRDGRPAPDQTPR